MGVNYFTDEQVKQLRNNPYVKNVSNKAITYEEGFKEYFIREYENGKNPSLIFKEAGFDTNVLGYRRIDSFSKRVRKQNKRIEGFEDQRKYSSGRPRTKDLTPEEKIDRLEAQNRLLRQENDFLKRVRYLNRRSLSKTEKTSQSGKSTSSSKET